jgi:hypothetical protein
MAALAVDPLAKRSIEVVGTAIPQSRLMLRAPLAGVAGSSCRKRRGMTERFTVPAGVSAGMPVFGMSEEEGTPLSVTFPLGAWFVGTNCACARTVVPDARDSMYPQPPSFRYRGRGMS